MESINNIVRKLRENRILNEKEDYKNMDHGDLIELAKDGDQLAIETLINEYTPVIKKVASKFILDSGDEDDLNQIATIGFWEAIQSWKPDSTGSFGAYASMIMKRKLTDELRKDSAGKVKINTYADRMDAPVADDGEGGELKLGDTIPSKMPDPEGSYMKMQDYLELKKFIENNFSEKEKKLFRLKFIEDMSNDELMEELGMSYKAVSNTIMRVKNKLADYKRNLRDSRKVITESDLEFTEEEKKIMRKVMRMVEMNEAVNYEEYTKEDLEEILSDIEEMIEEAEDTFATIPESDRVSLEEVIQSLLNMRDYLEGETEDDYGLLDKCEDLLYRARKAEEIEYEDGIDHRKEQDDEIMRDYYNSRL